MKTLLIILGLILWAYLAFYVPNPIKTVKITTPDPRITELEIRVKTLEAWAQKRGMRY